MPYNSSNLEVHDTLSKISNQTLNSSTVYLAYYNVSNEDLKLLVDALIEHQNAQQSVTTLNLCGNNIDEVGARELGKLLSRNSKITALYLGNNKLGPKGMEALCNPIIEHQALQILDISDNSIGKEGAQAVSKIIAENKELTSLNLSKNSLLATEVKILSEAIHKNHQKLTTIDLSNNPVGLDPRSGNETHVTNIEGKSATYVQWNLLQQISSQLGKLTKLNLTSTYIHSHPQITSVFSTLLQQNSLTELVISDWSMSIDQVKGTLTSRSSITALSLPPSSNGPQITELLERNKAITNSKKQIQSLLKDSKYDGALTQLEALKQDTLNKWSMPDLKYYVDLTIKNATEIQNKSIAEHKAKALSLISNDEHERAIAEYEKLKIIDTKYTEEYDNQIAQLRKMPSKDAVIVGHKKQALELASAGRYNEAINEYKGLREIDPTCLKKYDTQIKLLEDIIGKNEAIAGYKDQAQALVKQHKYEAAIEKYEALKALDTLGAESYATQIEYLEKILEKNKVIAGRKVHIQDLLKENKYVEAVAEYEALKALDAAHAKKYDTQIKRLTEAHERAKIIAEHKEHAQDLLNKKQYEEAIAKYKELKVLDTKRADDYEVQIKNLEKVKVQTETIARYQDQAQDLVNQKQYEAAIEKYEVLKGLTEDEQRIAEYDEQIQHLEACDKTMRIEQMQQLNNAFAGPTQNTEIFKLLGAGESVLQDKEEEAIILFGGEGAGKTTLSAALAGDELKAERNDEGTLHIQHTTDTGEQRRKIGPEHNKIPIKNHIDKTVVWDSPGFGDTTSTMEEITNSFYLSSLFKHTNKIKPVLVIANNEFFSSPNIDITTISRFAKLFDDVSAIKESVGLVITGVEPGRTIENVQARLNKIINNTKNLDSNVKCLLEHLHLNPASLSIFYRPKDEGPIEQDSKPIVDNFAALQSIETKGQGSFVLLNHSHDEIQILYEVVRENIKIVISNIIDSLKFKQEDIKPNAVLQLDHQILDVAFLKHWLLGFEQDNGYRSSTAHVHFPALQQLSELIDILGEPKHNGLEVSVQVLKSFEDQTSDKHIKKPLASYSHFLKQQFTYLNFFAEALSNEGKQVETQYPMEKILASRQGSIQENFYMAVKAIEVELDKKPSYYEEILKWVGQTPKPQELSVNAIEADAYYGLAHTQPKPVSAEEDTQLKLQLFLKAIKHNSNALQKAYKYVGDLMLTLEAPKRALNYYKCHKPSEKILECFEKMTESDPKNVDLLISRGDYELETYNKNIAKEYYMKALRALELLEAQELSVRRLLPAASLSLEHQDTDNDLKQVIADRIYNKINNVDSYNARLQVVNYSAVSPEQINDDLQWVTDKLETHLSGELGGHLE